MDSTVSDWLHPIYQGPRFFPKGHPWFQGPFHGCPWERFYMFAYCGLVVEIQPLANILIIAPLSTSTKFLLVARNGGFSTRAAVSGRYIGEAHPGAGDDRVLQWPGAGHRARTVLQLQGAGCSSHVFACCLFVCLFVCFFFWGGVLFVWFVLVFLSFSFFFRGCCAQSFCLGGKRFCARKC